jgi:hypothetical protein
MRGKHVAMNYILTNLFLMSKVWMLKMVTVLKVACWLELFVSQKRRSQIARTWLTINELTKVSRAFISDSTEGEH